jgi:hypothetical protein
MGKRMKKILSFTLNNAHKSGCSKINASLALVFILGTPSALKALPYF